MSFDEIEHATDLFQNFKFYIIYGEVFFCN